MNTKIYFKTKTGGLGVISSNIELSTPEGSEQISQEIYDTAIKEQQSHQEKERKYRESNARAQRLSNVKELLASGLTARQIILLGNYTEAEVTAVAGEVKQKQTSSKKSKK